MNKTNTNWNMAMLRKVVLCFCMLGIFSLFLAESAIASPSDTEGAYAVQQKKVTGKVVDEQGEPLVGATVINQTTTKGAITGADGSFELDANSTDKLLVQYLGMEDQVVDVAGQSVLLIKMAPKVTTMEDLTVVAFGQQKKESVVASITAVSPKDLKVSSSNFTTALAGRMAGLISYQRSGEPGADNAEFFVRGVTSFGYATEPLILLDGFEISADDLAALEPDNIEQFAILKDATAAALYGSKGANGVITVTTKQGQEGAAKVSFRHESRFSMPTQVPEVVDGITYMNYYNEAYLNDDPNRAPYYTSQKILNTQQGLNPYAYPNVNWYDEMFEDFAYNQHYTLNVSGGGKVVRYYVAGSYDRDNGVLKNNRLNNFKNNIAIDRFNIMAKVNVNITKTTKLEVNMNSTFKNYEGPNNASSTSEDSDTEVSDATVVFNNVMAGNPVEFPKYYSTQYLTGDQADELKLSGHTLFGTNLAGNMTNPYAQMVRGYKDGFQNTIVSQFTLNQDLNFVTEGLAAHAKVSIRNYSSYESRRAYRPYYYALNEYDEFNDTYSLVQVGEDGDLDLGDASTTRQTNSFLYFEAGVTYNRTFNDAHEVGATFIYTQEEEKKSGTSEKRSIQASLPSRNQGIRGRATYAYKGRYMLEASLTYNGSEKFNADHRWGLFPAVGVGYMISNEKFWEPLKKVVNNLKFRYSWGRVGNDDIAAESERFLFLSQITSSGDGGYYMNSKWGSTLGSYNVARMANPLITWEIATKQNVGIDLSLFEFADIMVEYFYEKRTGIYQRRGSMPSSTGLAGKDLYGNVGAAESSGIDASIDLKKSFGKDAFITGRFNFTYAHSNVLEKDEPAYKENLRHLSRVGYPVTQKWGYIAERLFVDANDVANSPAQEVNGGTGNVFAGDIKYKDIDGDGKVGDNDVVPIGYPTTPEINYGFGISATYKSFDLSFFFQGQGRSSFFINPNKINPFAGYRNALQYIADSHWSPDNPVSDAFWPRLSTGTANNNMAQYSTWWLRNGSFLRLKSVELGYSIAPSILKKTPIKSFRVYLSATNLFIISKFKLWDAEMAENGLGYPLQRVLSVGVNITF